MNVAPMEFSPAETKKVVADVENTWCQKLGSLPALIPKPCYVSLHTKITEAKHAKRSWDVDGWPAILRAASAWIEKLGHESGVW